MCPPNDAGASEVMVPASEPPSRTRGVPVVAHDSRTTSVVTGGSAMAAFMTYEPSTCKRLSAVAGDQLVSGDHHVHGAVLLEAAGGAHK